MNTLRVDAEMFKSGKKKWRIQKYPDTSKTIIALTAVKNRAAKTEVDKCTKTGSKAVIIN